MALILLMSDFDGRNAHVLVEEALTKSLEFDIEPIYFPENGLHPQYHMDLADKYLSKGSDSLVITHSENLLLRVMRRISRGEVSCSDVDLLVLTKYINNPHLGYYWKKIYINDEGEILDNTPGGFFEQGYRERFDIGDIIKLEDVAV